MAPPDDPAADRRWLAQAIELSRRCPPSQSAFSVGAVLLSDDDDGEILESQRHIGPPEAEAVVGFRGGATGRLGLPDGSDPPRPPAATRQEKAG